MASFNVDFAADQTDSLPHSCKTGAGPIPSRQGILLYGCRPSCAEHLGPLGGLDAKAWAGIGAVVTFASEITAIHDRRVEFRVSARTEADAIGEGTHERAIINVAKFAAKMAEKLSGTNPKKPIGFDDLVLEKDQNINDIQELKRILISMKSIEEQALVVISKLENQK